MPEPVIFLDGLKATRAARKAARRHVMKGKNTGKTLHRSSRLPLMKGIGHSAQHEEALYRHQSQGCRHERYGYTGSDGLRNMLGSLRLHVDVTPDSAAAVNQFFAFTADRLYPVHLGISLEEAKRTWLRVLFTDEHTYHCNLAIMRACNDLFDSQAHSSRALQHLSRTFTHVQKILHGDAALSDSSIAIVLSLVIQEQIRNHRHDASVHIQGLARMIELRGGLDGLSKNQTLQLKVCKIDIMYAIQTGGPPLYFRHQWPGFPQAPRPEPTYLDVGRLCIDLREVLCDVVTVCSLFNSAKHQMDLYTFEEVAVSLCYRLLRVRCINEGLATIDDQSSVQLGLLILAMTTFLKYGGLQIMDFPLIPACLQNVLETGMDSECLPTTLWLCLLGGIWLSDELDTEWLKATTAKTCDKLSVNSWTWAEHYMRGFPWIHVLHDAPGQRFWERAMFDSHRSVAI